MTFTLGNLCSYCWYSH